MIWRKGTPEDPYKEKMESFPVVNNQITLLEIPSPTHKVRIAGFTEIDQEVFDRRRTELQPNEILVNYSIGNIQFHPSHEGKTFLCTYFSRGLVMLPSSRVYTMVQRNPDIVKTLQEIIDEIHHRLGEYSSLLTEVREAISNARNATDNANRAADNAVLAKEGAIDATNKALDAAASTIMIYKEPVPKFDDLKKIYSNPENGWRVMIESTGDIYRFDGVKDNDWKLIDNYSGTSLPYASETSNGLLKKEDFSNFIHRYVIFSIPHIPNMGVQNYTQQFPFDGQVEKVTAICTKSGMLSPTEIQVEKIDESKYDPNAQWNSIFYQNIIFQPNEFKGSIPTLKTSQINKGDYLRINLIQLDNNIKGLTVQLDIKTKY
ncbi:hypothetical protein P4H70_15035 [Paenibacillus ehimensis]|uniref:hypothetical protein n=1 Tax=Paenibacillus ehimensis TaxID=79264 RepID=UPI002DB6E4DE|nr:hypothetical protein [Paenibacillus ehimensis]MEC0210251.1 hypothetical protein [Paenibacillus ehimensis]